MSKRQHGNKEAKKPKRATPKPPVPAASIAVDTTAVAPRMKK